MDAIVHQIRGHYVVYRFANLTLHSGSRELLRDGQTVRLAKLCFSLLLFLIEHRDRVVSKDALCEHVWGARAVSDDAIHTAIASVRRAVGDTAPAKRIIATVHRSGYRFVAPVTLGVVSEAPRENSFVGRETQVSQLLELARTSLQDQRLRVGLLSGDAGIGKTCTARRVAELACAEGFTAARGRGSENMDTPSWWPWIEVFRDLRGELGQQEWKAALDSASDSLLRFLRELEPIGPGPTSDSASGDAFRLVDDMVRLLCRISLSKPLIVLLDDLHRMDPSSLRLIEYALRLEAPARLLIVGTFRPGEATAAAFRTVLSQAASASSSIPFELPPLEEFEVAQLIEFESGQPPGAAYRQHVFERSEGNPFCVVELVRQTKQLADSGLGSAATSVPAGVWSMIATRLGRLPAECLNRLQAASVLGREFELHELAVMLDADYRAVLGSLQPALDARILESASGDKQLAFAHILIRDGLYAELPLVRRNELHLAAADSIAPADGVLDHPFQERIAHHRYVAAPAGDLERAIEACTSAARMLRKERFAFEEASRHWQRAVELLDLASEGNTNRRRQFLVSLAGCQYLSGDASTARATYLYAIDAARRAGDEVDLAHATLGLFDPNYRGNFSASFEDDTRNWIGLAREALDGLLETDQINLRAQLTSRLAIQLLRRHQLDDAEAESREALRLARRGCDSRIVAEVLADQHTLLIVRGEGELALESANEAVRLAQNSGDRARLLRSHLQLLDCGLASGDSALVRRQLDRVVSLGEPLGSYERRKMAIMEAILHGRVSAAWDLMIQVATERRRGSAESSANVPDILQQHALQKLARGFGGLLPIFTQHVRRDPSNLLVKSWLARALAETNQHEAADKAVRELSDRAEDVFQRRDWQIVVLEHAAASAQLGSCAGAERFSDALRPLRDGFVLWPGGTLCCGPVAHALGLYAGLLERWAEADSHFELAIERSARLGARPFVIAGQTGWAWALLRRGTPVARAHAQTLLEVAIREASQLGFAGLEASARKLVA